MSTTPLTTPVAVGLTVTLATFAFAFVPGAQAVTANYRCVPDGPVAVTTDSDAPVKMYVGESFTPTFTSVVTVPQDTRALRYDSGARWVDGLIVAQGDVDGTAVTPYALTVQRQSVPATGTLLLTAVGKGAPFVVPATPGDLAIHAGDFTASLSYYDEAQEPVPLLTDAATTCTLPPSAKKPTIDTVVVAARSSTQVTLSTTSSAYGQDVTAAATATVTGGAPDGQLNVVVNGVATKANLAEGGTATLDLGTLPVGQHSISAAFVPKDAIHYEASLAPAQTLSVGKASTTLRAPVSGRRTDVATRATARVAAAFGTEATGTVRFVLRKLTQRSGRTRWGKSRTLSGGKAVAGFGTLKKGRYKLVVTYRGDGNHDRSEKVRKFRVRRSR